MDELVLNESVLVSKAEIAASSGLSAREIDELVELGAFAPRTQEPAPLFAASCIELARAARQLRADFDLPLEGAALALRYRQRIQELKNELHRLRCQMPGPRA